MSTLADRVYYQVNNTEYQAAVGLGLNVYRDCDACVTTEGHESISEDGTLIQFKCRDAICALTFESLLTAASVSFTEKTKAEARTAAQSAAWRDA